MRRILTLPVRGNIEQLTASVFSTVVIDVLRASTVAVTALQNGASAIYPCASRQEAWQLRDTLRQQGIEPLLCGERQGLKIEGFDLGNSPREFTADQVSGRTLIMATTNGTRALKAAEGFLAGQGDGWITFAAFVNAGAVAARIHQSPGDCLLVCSGKLGMFSLEDFVGAGLIIEEILKRGTPERWSLDDASRAAQRLYSVYRDFLLELLQSCSHGAYLVQCGFAEDLPLCAQASVLDCVPIYRNGALVAFSG